MKIELFLFYFLFHCCFAVEELMPDTETCFYGFDADHDGELSYNEIEKFFYDEMEHIYNKSGLMINTKEKKEQLSCFLENAIKNLDLNNDNKLSFEELTSA